MRVVHLLSTYNEKENIGPMIEYLEEQAKKLPKYEIVILVVDSHSPDGTGEIVKKMAKTRENVHLLETPRGLGISLIKGYKYAMEKLKADIVIPNDVDFQWHPKYIPQMLERLEEGYGVVVPSRHAPGGKDNFSAFRKLTHFVSNTLINYWWGGIREVKDLAGNFKAIRVKGVLEKVNFDKLDVKGFVIQSTMIYELSKTGVRFCEIPVVYGERRAGETKVSFNLQFVKDALETLINATKIRIERSKRFFKFATVGFIGYIINAGGLEIFYRLGMPVGFAAALAAEFSIISNYTLNNFWTFAEKRFTKPLEFFWKLFQFNFTSLGAIVIQAVVVGGLAYLFGDAWRQIYLVIAIGFFIIPYNYTIYNVFIWKTWKVPFLSKLQKRVG